LKSSEANLSKTMKELSIIEKNFKKETNDQIIIDWRILFAKNYDFIEKKVYCWGKNDCGQLGKTNSLSYPMIF